MNSAPADRHHFGRRVELQGTGAQRNHRGGEREVARFEPLDVAQHLGFRVMPVEYRVLQDRTSSAPAPPGMARSLFTPDVVQHERERLVQRKDRDQVGQVAQGHGLVQRDAQPGGGQRPEVDVAHPSGVEQPGQRPALDLHAHGIEVRLVHHLVPQPAEGVGQQHGAGVHPLGDAPEPRGSVVHGIHARHHREQHLCGAHVAGGLVPADVLLPGLQRHAQRRAAVPVADTPMIRPGSSRL